MDFSDLVHAVLTYDALTARQWVTDSLRMEMNWSLVPLPRALDALEASVAAGLAEMLASRVGQAAPGWAHSIQATTKPVWLVKAASTMPRLRQLCEEEGPEPLRRRGILAPPDFLRVA